MFVFILDRVFSDEKVYVVGYLMGGFIVVKWVSLYVEYVVLLILIGYDGYGLFVDEIVCRK